MYSITNYNVNVYIDGYNFSNYLVSISRNPEEKSFFGNTITIPNASLVMNNTNEAFSYMNERSFFYNRDYTEATVKIGYNLGSADEVIVFIGLVSKIVLDGYNASISVESSLQRVMTKTALYIGNDDSPAYHAKELLKLYNVEIDEISFGNVINLQEADSIRCSVTALPLHKLSIINLLQTLSDIGLMTIYYEAGIVKCEYFKNKLSSNQVQDSDIFNKPKIETLEYSPYDGYAIETVSSTIHYNSENGKNIKAITAGSSSVVKIHNALSALNIGEFYLNESKVLRDKIFS